MLLTRCAGLLPRTPESEKVDAEKYISSPLGKCSWIAAGDGVKIRKLRISGVKAGA
jgi:hypothetical protein